MSISSTSSVSASISAAPGTGTSRVGLEAQLSRFQKQLSDCENCESAKTPEGKAQIAELIGKVDTTQARIKAFDEMRTANDASRSVQVVPPADIPRRDNSGNVIDVYA